ncbi:hypothetical protein [Xenophilus sp.]|uniref:hypothetical protein n=1 Tax=Xenophilus sp. TaxID=1873499 RepID=UPI0037DC9E3E
MNTEFPPLKVEACPDGLITLTDPIADGYGNEWSVRIHPEQLRWIAQQAGFIREVSASDADMLRTERERAAQAIADLERLIPWLEMIETRCSQLHDNILGVGQAGDDDVNIEIAQSAALADIAEQVLKDAQAALSRHVTPCHANQRHKTPGNAASKAPIGEGMGAARGNATSVTQALVERYPGVTNAASALEREAMDTFRSFVRENAALLRVVAHWGDGECGALLDVLKAELLSRGTPEGRAPDASGMPGGTVSVEARRNTPSKTQQKPMANPAGSDGKPTGSGQLSLEEGG